MEAVTRADFPEHFVRLHDLRSLNRPLNVPLLAPKAASKFGHVVVHVNVSGDPDPGMVIMGEISSMANEGKCLVMVMKL